MSAVATAPVAETRAPEASRPRMLVPLVFTLVAAALFAIRLAGPPNFLDNEYRLGAFVLNATQGGNWLAPHDLLGYMYKPPMLTWLSALASLATRHVSRFTLYLPTALATLGTAWLVFSAAAESFGWEAGFFGGLCYLLSYVASQQMATARHSPVIVSALHGRKLVRKSFGAFQNRWPGARITM